MVSWRGKIVIAEPAPRLAYPARYLAPVIHDDDPQEASFIPLIVALATGLVLITLGGGIGELAARTIAQAARVPAWIGFDLLATAVVLTAYTLVARHGLRFPTGMHEEDIRERRILVERGNIAWRCLPEPQRQVHAEHVRTMNAAARLVLVDPDDEEASTVLRATARELHQLALQRQDPPQSVPTAGT